MFQLPGFSNNSSFPVVPDFQSLQLSNCYGNTSIVLVTANIRLASHLVRAPNSRSGGHEFESLMRWELGALTKSGKTLGVRSFYSGDPDDVSEHVANVITCLPTQRSPQLDTSLAESLA